MATNPKTGDEKKTEPAPRTKTSGPKIDAPAPPANDKAAVFTDFASI